MLGVTFYVTIDFNLVQNFYLKANLKIPIST